MIVTCILCEEVCHAHAHVAGGIDGLAGEHLRHHRHDVRQVTVVHTQDLRVVPENTQQHTAHSSKYTHDASENV